MADLVALFDDGDGDNDMLLTASQRRPTSLAEESETPSSPRPPSGFAGLLNQGTTCYLNSLLQALYMTPEFREAIYRLDLCTETPDTRSELITDQRKWKVLFHLQTLFVYLQALDEKAQSTKPLTDSFEWSAEDVVVQHDAQELSRVLFDVIEQSLASTPHFSLIQSLYKGVFAYQTECEECHNVTELQQDFGDLSVNVKALEGLQAAIRDMCKPELLTGGNRYFCEICGNKVDAQRRTALKSLPPILIFSLNRFEYVQEQNERRKITTSFSFPLELDMKEFVADESNAYELFGVLIHRGTAHHGHYHVFLRDVAKEGVWTPLEEQGQTQTTDAESAASQVRFADEVSAEELQQIIDTKEAAEKDGDWEEPNKRKQRRKRLRKGGRRQEKQRSKGQKQEKPKLVPMEADNKELLYGWFDFDDSTVTAISADALSAEFGGSSETAYMLIYRKAGLERTEQPMIPFYWAERLSQMNSELTEKRNLYEDMKRQVSILVQTQDLFMSEDSLLKYVSDKQPYTSLGQAIAMRLENTVGELKRRAAAELKQQEVDTQIELIEVMRLSHGFVHLLRTLDSVSDDDTLEKASVKHLSCFLALPRGQCGAAWQCVGQQCEPIIIKARMGKTDCEVPVNKGWSLAAARTATARKLGRSEEEVTLNVHGKGSELLALTEWEKTLDDLKWYHGMSVICLQPSTPSPASSIPEVAVPLPSSQISIIVYDEEDQENVVQHYVSLKWKLSKLITELKTLFKVDIPVECRLRRLVDNYYFSQEDLPKILSQLEFTEGSARLCFERGVAPKAGEIVLKVALKEVELDVFVSAKATISELKTVIGETFNIDIEEYKVYKSDWLREATTALKNDEQSLTKAQIKAGEYLLVHPKDFAVVSEQVTLHLYVTITGIPGEDVLTQDLQVPFDLRLGELRSRIFSLNLFTSQPPSADCIRLRERTKAGHYGKIYQEDGKTLKTLKISYQAQIVCQAFSQPVAYSAGLSLFVCLRDPVTRTSSKPVECVFEGSPFPTIDDLYSFVLAVTGQSWNLSEIVLAKYIPFQFTWEVIEDPRNPSERGSLLGTPPNKSKKGIYNLKKTPVNLKDGDLIAAKHTLADPNDEDNFLCESDRVKRESFAKEKSAPQKEGKRRKEAGVHILV